MFFEEKERKLGLVSLGNSYISYVLHFTGQGIYFTLANNVHLLLEQVLDQDIGQDKRLGIVKLPLIDLEAEATKEFELRLLPSLDMLKIKDKKDRGTITVKVDTM